MKAASLDERGLLVQLNLSYSRALEIAWLRRAAAAAVPIWLAARWPELPGIVPWLAFLAQGTCLVVALGHGVCERRWSHRAAQLQPGPTLIETPWTPWDEVRSALWYGLAIVSAVPWVYAGFGRALPVSLRATLEAGAWAVLVLLAAAETAAIKRPADG